MLVIYPCITDYHGTELENNKHLLSHIFCSSGIQEHLSWVVLAQGFSHEVVVKMSARATVSEELTGSWKIHFQAHFCSFWQEASDRQHTGCSISSLWHGLPKSKGPKEKKSRASEREQRACPRWKPQQFTFIIHWSHRPVLVPCDKGLHKGGNTRRWISLEVILEAGHHNQRLWI